MSADAWVNDVPPDPVTVQLTRMSDVVPERVRWLWHARIPFGKITILDGNPGEGKTTAALDLAARLTRGHSMPTEGHGHDPAGVLILTAEDGLGDTIRPRLEVAGADLASVHALTGIGTDGPEGFRLPTLRDVPHLLKATREAKAGLVIIDPVMAFLGPAVDSAKDQDVRQVLHPLSLLAETTGAAVVLIRHLNKTRGGPAIYRGGGSIGIVGAARSGLVVARDPADEGRRILASVKCNLAPSPPSVAYRIVTENDVARVSWEGIVDASAEDLLADHDHDPEAREGRAGAEAFLREVLADGPLPAKQVLAEARVAGVAEKTLRRAQKAMGVRVTKHGGRFGEAPAWVWSLEQGGQGGHPTERPSWPSCPPEGANADQGGQGAHVEGRPSWPSSEPESPLPAAVAAFQPLTLETFGELSQIGAAIVDVGEAL